MNLNFKLENDTLTLLFEGRIDSANAANIEQEIFDILHNNKFVNVIFDALKLEYISSAGLRVILKIKKENPEFKLINASIDVYEIFEMTGFTEMMSIEKAYRKLSVDGCKIIGTGANGTVYRYDPETIIKVYYNNDALADIKKERELARKAFIMGVPTAISYDIVQVGDHYGSVFELLEADSMANLLCKEDCDVDSLVKVSVDILNTIHTRKITDNSLPDIKAKYIKWIDTLSEIIPEEEFTKLKKLINDIPESNTMIHGDYHVKNIMFQNDEALLIDMDTLAMGHPIFEFAAIYNAYIGYNLEEGSDPADFFGIPDGTAITLLNKTIKQYYKCEDDDINTIIDKLSVIGLSRILSRYIRRFKLDNEHNIKTYNMYRELLINAIRKVDDLNIA